MTVSVLFLIGIHSSHAEQPLPHMELQEKEYKKVKAYRKPVSKEPTDKRCLLTLGLKAISIIDQRKTFYRQRIQESRGERKEIFDIDGLIKSRNADRKML